MSFFLEGGRVYATDSGNTFWSSGSRTTFPMNNWQKALVMNFLHDLLQWPSRYWDYLCHMNPVAARPGGQWTILRCHCRCQDAPHR